MDFRGLYSHEGSSSRASRERGALGTFRTSGHLLSSKAATPPDHSAAMLALVSSQARTGFKAGSFSLATRFTPRRVALALTELRSVLTVYRSLMHRFTKG